MNIPDTMVIVGWILAVVGASCTVGWLIWEAFTAPTIEFADDEGDAR